MAGYIGTQAVSVNTTSATISDDLSVGDDALITGTLTTTAATVFSGGFASNDGSTISTADNTVELTLTSTSANANSGPIMNFYRNSASPAAGDSGGLIEFIGKNDAGQDVTLVQIEAELTDVADASEDVALKFGLRRAGGFVDALSFDPTEVVFNDSSIDMDFRVESDDYPFCLFVNSTQDNVSIGYSAESQQASKGLVVLSGDETGGVYIVKEDGSQPSSGEGLGSLGWRGTDDTNTMGAADARITAFAAENHDGSNSATDMRFFIKTTSQGPGNGPIETLRLESDKNVKILDGNLVIGTAGHGINFAANANNSGMESELLDDYETGTFTMTLGQVSAGAFGIGRYVKVGRVVHFQWYSNGTINVDQGAGGGSFSGLPFTTDDDNASYGVFSNAHNTYCPTATTGYINPDAVTGIFTAPNTTSAAAVVTGTGKYLMLAGTYRSKA